MHRERIAALLPQVMQRTRAKESVLEGLVAAMEAHHAPIETALENLDACFDPLRAHTVRRQFAHGTIPRVRNCVRLQVRPGTSAISGRRIASGPEGSSAKSFP